METGLRGKDKVLGKPGGCYGDDRGFDVLPFLRFRLGVHKEMSKIYVHFERSWLFLLTIPLSILIWGGFALYNTIPKHQYECVYKVSSRSIIHGPDSNYRDMVVGPCHHTLEEAERYRDREFER